LAAELRWILLGLSLPLLAGIWWWTARRSGQAPGNAELRESTAGRPAEAVPALDARRADSQDDDVRPLPETGDWSVSPFEPLNIHTVGYDHVPVLDGPMMVDADPARNAAPEPAPAPSPEEMITSRPVDVTPVAQVEPAAAAAPSLRVSENSDRFGIAVPPASNQSEVQRIVTIRVCTVGDERWSGGQLMAALEVHGLAFGRYQVFHRKHADGRSLFCVASLIEPGTFDIAEMADQEFRGVTLFAVLPGPAEPLETIDELIITARGLAEELSGMVQDAKGMPLSPQRAATLREDIARFQASLPRN
jgi:cell division protein ZipA